MKSLVAYESRLELARKMLADFDPDVIAIASQPFRLIAADGSRIRRPVPDVLLLTFDGGATVVDVKSPARREDPDVRAVMEWTRRARDSRTPGVTWGSFAVDKIRPSSVERSRHRFRAHLTELIWNTAALEGNNFTLPEEKTLLEGVTVGGKSSRFSRGCCHLVRWATAVMVLVSCLLPLFWSFRSGCGLLLRTGTSGPGSGRGGRRLRPLEG
jgi:hypothetical protein